MDNSVYIENGGYVSLCFAKCDTQRAETMARSLIEAGMQLMYDIEAVENRNLLSGSTASIVVVSPEAVEDCFWRESLADIAERKIPRVLIKVKPVILPDMIQLILMKCPQLVCIKDNPKTLIRWMKQNMPHGAYFVQERKSEPTQDDYRGAYTLVRLSNHDSITISDGRVRLGSKPALSDYVITGNIGISRHHADIIVDEGCCFVEDAGSTNGTHVNAVIIPAYEKVRLYPGDVIMLERERFRLDKA